MKNNLEEIVKEKPSIKKRISGFIKRKALPWILAGALAVGFYGYRNISSPVSGSVRLTNAFRAESPTFSPDSKKLAYLEWEDTNRNGEWDDPDELYVCVKNTKSQKLETRKMFSGAYLNWGADNKLYFARGKAIWRMNPNGKNLERLTENIEAENIGGLVLSPQIDKIAFRVVKLRKVVQPNTWMMVSYVWIVDSYGKNIKEIGQGDSPSFSPNGTKVAFERREDTEKNNILDVGDISQIFEYDLKTEKEKQLTFEGSNSEPYYLPDGRIIYEHDPVTNGKAEFTKTKIHVMNADGSNTRRLTTKEFSGYEEIKAVSPDGKYLIFVTHSGRNFLMEITTGKLKKLGSRRDYFEVSFSPNSKSLAHVLTGPWYERKPWNRANIYLKYIK